MIKCPYCQAQNIDNSLFCSECGTYLLAEEYEITGMLGPAGKSSKPFAETNDLKKSPIHLRLQFPDLDREMEFNLVPHQELLVGRSDPASNVFPEVDLAAEEALEKGVSRRHARIAERGGALVVEDLGSVNGTSVNNRRLPPYLPAKLKTDDVIQIGQIVMRVLIDSPSVPTEG